MSLDSTHGKPRCERLPSDYVSQITDSYVNSLLALKAFESEIEIIEQILNPVAALAAKAGLTGDDVHDWLSNPAQLPEGAVVDNRITWALIASANCANAIIHEQSGNLTEAWTFVIDARFAADALLSQITDQHFEKAARKAVSTKAVMAKLANDPKQAAKLDARKLWQDWQEGRTVHKSAAAFARYVVGALPIESTKTVERWIQEWRRTKTPN